MSTVQTAPATEPNTAARLDLAERLARLGQTGLDEVQAERLALLSDKLARDRCVLAFCGHFSAGKSTLVNRLAGSQILPSSPIPTSANQVLIRHGAPGATVRFRQRGAVDLAPSELDRLGAYCVDGDAVDGVEIRHPLRHVPDGLWLMDTPGIDSTDEAHRLVTESALYLADAVFYVMDYNHVQSEVNLRFTRSLAEWGKPVYLVINQIDKHVELELSFAQFRRSVTNAFAAWGAQPEGVFFITLREPDHPLNEWPALLETLERLGEHREALLLSGVWKSAAHLMREEEHRRTEACAAERDELTAALEAGGPDPHLRSAVVAAELDGLSRAPEAVVENLMKEGRATLANAPIFPYATRELAERYLEARKPGFRAGLFASAARTTAEVESRLQALHKDLSEKVKAHIDWHLQELFRRYGEQEGGRNPEYEAAVQAFTVPFGPELLAALVKTQSVGAREYRVQYFQDVAEEIQTRYRRAMKGLVDEVAAKARARADREAEPLRAEAEQLSLAIAAADRLNVMEAASRTYRETWTELLGANPGATPAPRAVEPDRAEEEADQGRREASSPPGFTAVPAGDAMQPEASRGHEARQEAARRLQAATRLLAPLPGMALAAADLNQRAQRLKESRFTVALFGAFSAGKSSFANALMGMQLLPVSPNPTTAVITRIEPPTPDRPHGHVHVLWKSAEQLRREVDQALGALGLSPTGDLAADLAAGAKRSQEATTTMAKAHAAFLVAAARGYGAVIRSLGQAETTGLEQFASLVADEQRSCFVAEITVHVDCPVTRQGITLVDTPGADSINARHTDVAFDYIKNADAILFVTYYNHAFSRADREFLIQLGRVKDSFALDKMFFLINAVDLAADAAELELVVDHVRSNLQACAIRQPRIFPISSQTALWSRLSGAGALPRDLVAKLQHRLGAAEAGPDLLPLGLQASGMERFEAEFYRFVVADLSQMAIDAATAELRRSAQTIEGWLEAAREDESGRARRLQQLQIAQSRAQEAIHALDAGAEAQELERAIDELLYYVKRRVLLERFPDTFRLAFNPSTLRDGPDLKRALREALREVLELVGFDLAQEMRATALRVENALNRQAERAAQRAASSVSRHLMNWSGPAHAPVHPQVPAFSDGRAHLRPEPYEKLLGLFKSPERFFAGGGRTQLLDELQKALEEPVTGYLAGARAVLSGWYGGALTEAVAASKAQLATSVTEHGRGLTAALAGTGESVSLAATLEQLRKQM